MRWLATTIVALGTLMGASATAQAAAAPGPGAKAAMPDASQVEKVHRRWHRHGFGGFGLYIGPRYGGYYDYPYYDDYYYRPRYRYRRWHRHRHHRHRWRHRRHHW